ncbi:hypothetical protein C0J52_11470, partial [Blattella germanica]
LFWRFVKKLSKFRLFFTIGNAVVCFICATTDNNALAFWPPNSPDLTPCDFFLLDDLKQAVASVDADMLQRVWDELDYRIDVCRVTRGAHIKHLRPPLQTSENGVKIPYIVFVLQADEVVYFFYSSPVYGLFIMIGYSIILLCSCP